MKISLVSSVLSLLTVVVSLNVAAQAVVAPASNNVPNMSKKNLTAAISMEKSVHDLINQFRQTQKLPPLVFDQSITQEARVHSLAMANVGRISHDGFDARVNVVGRAIPYRRVAENVASNKGYAKPGHIAVEDWIKSPGHLINIIDNFDLTGVGVVERDGFYYFTQIFVRKR
jgi:uncharacterized protein YkwD